MTENHPVPSPSVAIVGAGWSGLAAAVELTRQGAQVTLYESARQAGGRARRVDWEGSAVDNGQHLLIGAYTETFALMRQVDVDPATAFLRLPMRVFVPKRMDLRLPRLMAPLHVAFGLLRTNGVGLFDKLSAARMMRDLQSKKYQLPAGWTVAQWLDAHHQHGVLREHLWQSLCLAALNTHPEDASAKVFANVLRDTLGADREATDFLLPRDDLGSILPDAALRWLTRQGANVHLSTRVQQIRREDTGWKVETNDPATCQLFNQIILATGPQHVAALLPEDAALKTLRTQLEHLLYEPIATAYLQYPPALRLPAPILALNEGIAQWVVDRGQLSASTPGLIAHVLSAHGDWEKLPSNELAMALDQSMRRALPTLEAAPAPLHHLIIREQRATFRCTPNLLRPGTRTALPGLLLAGDYVHNDYPGTLEGAVRNGLAAANAVFRELTPVAATAKKPPRWRRWAKEGAIALAIVLAIGFWQTRNVVQGMAPDFSGASVSATDAPAPATNEAPLSLDQWRARHSGRATAVYFFANWCPICKLNEGGIDSVMRDHPILPVAMQSGDNAAVAAFLARRGLNWQAINDPNGTITSRYGFSGVPALIVLDPQGRIRFAEQGYTSEWGLRWRLLWANTIN